MDYASRGNLFEYVCLKPLSENAVCYYMRQLLDVIHFMHTENGVCHRDLKPENLLLDSEFKMKVADFGFAAERKGFKGDFLHYTCKGTLGYMAPEILNLNICET